ncbi:hypothetical protein MTP04_04970 [Lysinibacillus sp. PLM2]|nr:hypothetical protein MTP04_04970 [Lysinibacillus sp. PLM2]
MRNCLIFFICLFLMGCTVTNNAIADTPEKALRLIESKGQGYPKILSLLNSIEISEKQVFYVYEAEINSNKEWFVANLEKNDDSKWFVHESINIGMPNSENEIYAAGTNTFTAGLSNDLQEIKDDWIVINIPSHNYFVWIELHGD